MEIVVNKGKTINVLSVKAGEVFRYNGKFYCKVENERGGVWAVNLKTGNLIQFLNYNTIVEILSNAKIVFEE